MHFFHAVEIKLNWVKFTIGLIWTEKPSSGFSYSTIETVWIASQCSDDQPSISWAFLSSYIPTYIYFSLGAEKVLIRSAAAYKYIQFVINASKNGCEKKMVNTATATESWVQAKPIRANTLLQRAAAWPWVQPSGNSSKKMQVRVHK